MKIIKKAAALLMVAVMSLSVAGCHKKDEIAVTINGIEFTSAYYMCALINAYMEAKSLVYEDLSDEEKQQSDIDYYSKKVEDTDYVEWVENRAIEQLKKIASYKLLCEENGVEPDEELLNNAETNASYYWSGYGYSVYFEPNGVGEKTYINYAKDSVYSETYFEYLYGEGGEKEISADDVKTKIYDNFLIANILEADYEDDSTDEEKAALKTKLENYAKQLESGEKTFEEVYNDYNGVTAEAPEMSTEEGSAKDKYAQVIGSEDTNYSSTHYETIKAMKTGETKVQDNESSTGLYLFVKQDIQADPFYLTDLDMEARHLIADEEYEKLIEEYADKLEPDINNYAVNQFKVKKIVDPTASA